MKKSNSWKKVGGGDFAPSFRFTEKGQWIEGAFIASRVVKSDKFEKGEATYHDVEIVKGSNGIKPGRVSLQGSGLLNYLIKSANLAGGEEVRIEYGGKEKYKSGKKERSAHRFELFTRG